MDFVGFPKIARYMDQIDIGIDYSIQELAYGSIAAPGFMKPEGIVIFHAASGQLFKKTLEKDDSPKGLNV